MKEILEYESKQTVNQAYLKLNHSIKLKKKGTQNIANTKAKTMILISINKTHFKLMIDQ